MTTMQAVLLLELVMIVALLAALAWSSGRLSELEREHGCSAGQHPWVLMTGGREGFVRWYRCARPGCSATRFVKGSER